MTRLLTFSLCAALVLMFSPSRTSAAPVSSDSFPHYCIESHELASIVQAEGRNQPYPARVAMAQIVHQEAMERGITVCALSRLTNFVAVRHHSRQYPQSWTAYQFANPDPAFIQMAEQVMAGELDRVVPLEYQHFDNWNHNDSAAIQIGGIWFRY